MEQAADPIGQILERLQDEGLAPERYNGITVRTRFEGRTIWIENDATPCT